VPGTGGLRFRANQGDNSNMSKAERIVEAWNETHTVGTEVTYYPVKGRKAGAKRSRTRTEAQVMGGHTPVVWIEDHAGCVALDHCVAVPK